MTTKHLCRHCVSYLPREKLASYAPFYILDTRAKTKCDHCGIAPIEMGDCYWGPRWRRKIYDPMRKAPDRSEPAGEITQHIRKYRDLKTNEIFYLARCEEPDGRYSGWHILPDFKALIRWAEKHNLKAYIGYGSYLEGDSADIDLIYCPLHLIEDIKDTDYWTLLENPQGDCITKNQLLKNDLPATFAYLNIVADYSYEFAEKWKDSIGITPLPIGVFLDKNTSVWKKEFENTLLPRVWAKWQFAHIQKQAWEQGGIFLNRKSQVLNWAEQHMPDIATALREIWYGSPYNNDVLNIIGIEYGVEDGEIHLRYRDRSVSYPLNIEVNFYSATPEEIEDTVREELNNVIEDPGYAEDIMILYNGKNVKIYVKYDVIVWDGYGL